MKRKRTLISSEESSSVLEFPSSSEENADDRSILAEDVGSGGDDAGKAMQRKKARSGAKGQGSKAKMKVSCEYQTMAW